MIQRERKIVSNIESLVMRFINFKALEYEKIRLSEILDRIKGKKHLASEGKDEGEYPFIVSSNIKKKFCDSYDYEDHCLIVGNGGIPNIHFEEKFSISSHMLLFKAKENFIIDFVYYLKANMRIIENGFNGTTIKNINLSNFLNIEIPNFPLEKQKLLSHSFEILRAKKGNIKGYQKMLNMLIDEMIPKI